MNPFIFPVQIQTSIIQAPHIQVYIPQIISLPNPTIEKQLNQTILQQAQSMIQFQIEQQGGWPAEMLGSYEIKTNERAILSLSQQNYAFVQHHAHGLTRLLSLTANARTGKTYTLSELFKPNSNYIARLSEIIQIQIRARNIDVLQPFTSIRPDQDFYVADKSLVIYFQQVEITPYYYGFPMFPISVYQIQDIVQEGSPLDILSAS